MSVHKPKYSKKEVSQRYNLKNLLGYEPSQEQKELFYNLAVDKMVERTTSGNDIDGIRFTPYSPSYAESKGVSKDSVDLVLTGEMLSSFQESQKQKNVVKIKLADGEQTLKGYNHNVGDTLPKRTFFGFKSESDIRDIIQTVDSVREVEQESIDLSELRSAIRSLSIQFEGFDGDS